MLDGGGIGVEGEGGFGVVELHGVSGEGAEIGEEGPEGLDGEAVVSALGGGLLLGGGRALGGFDDGVPEGFGGFGVVVVEEEGCEVVSHVPLDVVGEHAEEDVGADAVGASVVDRSDLEVDGFEGAEGALDAGEVLVGADGLGASRRSGSTLERMT